MTCWKLCYLKKKVPKMSTFFFKSALQWSCCQCTFEFTCLSIVDQYSREFNPSFTLSVMIAQLCRWYFNLISTPFCVLWCKNLTCRLIIWHLAQSLSLLILNIHNYFDISSGAGIIYTTIHIFFYRTVDLWP